MARCVVIKWLDVNDKNYLDKSKYVVVNYNYVATLPIIGAMEEGFEILIRKDLNPFVGVDSRLYISTPFEGATEENDTTYPAYKQYVFSYTVTPTDNSVKITCVDEAESNALNKVFPIEKQMKRIAISLALLKKVVQGGTLTATQSTYLNKIDDYALSLWQNHTISQAKKAAIVANVAVDLDSDWETSEIAD